MTFDKTPKTDTAAALLGYAYGDIRDTALVANHLMPLWHAEQGAAPKRRKFKPRSTHSARPGLSGVRQFQRRNSAAATLHLPKLPNGKAISQPAPKLDLGRTHPFERVEIDEYYIDLSPFLEAIEMQHLNPPSSAPVMRGTIERFFRDAGARLSLAHSKA